MDLLSLHKGADDKLIFNKKAFHSFNLELLWKNEKNKTYIKIVAVAYFIVIFTISALILSQKHFSAINFGEKQNSGLNVI